MKSHPKSHSRVICTSSACRLHVVRTRFQPQKYFQLNSRATALLIKLKPIVLYRLFAKYLPPVNEVWGKVIFSQAYVSHSVYGGGFYAWSYVPSGVRGLCPGGGSLSGGGSLGGRGPPLCIKHIHINKSQGKNYAQTYFIDKIEFGK